MAVIASAWFSEKAALTHVSIKNNCITIKDLVRIPLLRKASSILRREVKNQRATIMDKI